MKMMIVDDSLVMRRKIERSVAIDQITNIVTATNGKEAVTLFKREMPELVTMDLTMPELDGVQAVKQIVEMNPSVRILVVSALADKLTAIKAIENGARGFLCKPIDDQALNDALQEVLREGY